MRESLDHRPAGGIGQSRKCCTQFIHNQMVVDYRSMSSVNFAIPDFCLPIPVWLATTIATSAKSPSHSSTLIGNGKSASVDRFEGTLDNEHPEVCEAGHF